MQLPPTIALSTSNHSQFAVSGVVRTAVVANNRPVSGTMIGHRDRQSKQDNMHYGMDLQELGFNHTGCTFRHSLPALEHPLSRKAFVNARSYPEAWTSDSSAKIGNMLLLSKVIDIMLDFSHELSNLHRALIEETNSNT